MHKLRLTTYQLVKLLPVPCSPDWSLLLKEEITQPLFCLHCTIHRVPCHSIFLLITISITQFHNSLCPFLHESIALLPKKVVQHHCCENRLCTCAPCRSMSPSNNLNLPFNRPKACSTITLAELWIQLSLLSALVPAKLSPLCGVICHVSNPNAESASTSGGTCNAARCPVLSKYSKSLYNDRNCNSKPSCIP